MCEVSDARDQLANSLDMQLRLVSAGNYVRGDTAGFGAIFNKDHGDSYGRNQTQAVGFKPIMSDNQLALKQPFNRGEDFNWKNPGFEQTNEHPVVCAVGETPKRSAVGLARRKVFAIGCLRKLNGSTLAAPEPKPPSLGATNTVVTFTEWPT